MVKWGLKGKKKDDYGVKGKKAVILQVWREGWGVYTAGGEERGEWRRTDNLDEEEELTEAGQQRQKAPQDTVVHVPEL